MRKFLVVCLCSLTMTVSSCTDDDDPPPEEPTENADLDARAVLCRAARIRAARTPVINAYAELGGHPEASASLKTAYEDIADGICDESSELRLWSESMDTAVVNSLQGLISETQLHHSYIGTLLAQQLRVSFEDQCVTIAPPEWVAMDDAEFTQRLDEIANGSCGAGGFNYGSFSAGDQENRPGGQGAGPSGSENGLSTLMEQSESLAACMEAVMTASDGCNNPLANTGNDDGDDWPAPVIVPPSNTPAVPETNWADVAMRALDVVANGAETIWEEAIKPTGQWIGDQVSTLVDAVAEALPGTEVRVEVGSDGVVVDVELGGGEPDEPD
ncbi:MAG: hypothetical protein AAGE52_42320, partial [Myxococcota bacterium]